jgi:DNA-binding CsgD family transcriptional regulator/tetratricopeptide (TPR) repeat protein
MPPIATSALLEREDELAALDAALSRARTRRGSVVLVAGEAGIGKSTLLSAWRERLAPTDTRVLAGWCDDFLTGRTLGPLRDVGRATSGALAEAVAAADTGAVLDAALDLLDDPLRPVVLALEDVHWADEATLDVVRYVGRRIADLPALLVLSFRDDEVDAEHPLTGVLGALVAAPVTRLTLRPLSRPAIATLLGDDGPDPDRVARVTGGNPFFVTELARTRGDDVPATVAEAVVARARTLSVAPRQALETLSVMPGAVDRELVGVIIGDVTVLAPAERRGLLVTSVDEVRFRHELARRAVEASLTTTEQVAAHQRVLDVLLEVGHPDAVPVLHHAVGAGARDVVAAHGPGAATEAFRAGAHRQAAAVGAQVLAVADLLAPEEHARLLEQHAWALYNLHDFDSARVAAREAAELRAGAGDPGAHARALLTWSRMAYIGNDPATAQDVMDRAVAVAADVEDDELAAEMRVHRLQLAVLTDDRHGVDAVAGTVVTAAEAVDRDDLVVLAHNYEGLASINRGDVEDGLDHLREAVALGRRVGALEATARSYTSIVEELLLAGHWDEGAERIAEATAYYGDHDFAAHGYNTTAQQGLLWVWQGRWPEAEALFRDLYASVRHAGVLEALALTPLARLAVWQGWPEAEDLLAHAWEVALTTRATQYVTALGVVRIEFAWLHDRPAMVAPTLERALATAATADRGAELLRRLQVSGFDDGVEIDPDQYPEPHRSGLRGDWASAAATWDARGATFQATLERLASGEVDPMLEALRVLEGLDATAGARWVRRRLRELGVRSIPRGPRPETREHPAGLTARQVEVLGLLAEGLTNAEIADRLVVSTRTVDHHVSAILGRLGVATRREAVEAAAGLEPG